jgi:inhibitor of cysteine peptidase
MRCRRRGVVVLWIVAVLLILTAGCGGKGAQPPVEESDPTQPIEVRVGEEFVIILKANPTTGYQWQLAQPLDEGKVELVGSEYKAPEGDRVGAGGTEVWTFKAVGAGKTTIALEYVRPWEKDAPPAETRAFTVVIQ